MSFLEVAEDKFSEGSGNEFLEGFRMSFLESAGHELFGKICVPI